MQAKHSSAKLSKAKHRKAEAHFAEQIKQCSANRSDAKGSTAKLNAATFLVRVALA